MRARTCSRFPLLLAAALLLRCTAAAPTLPTKAVLPVTGAGSGCQDPLGDLAAVQAAWRATATAVQDALTDPECIQEAITYVPPPGPPGPGPNPAAPLLACLAPYAEVRGCCVTAARAQRSRPEGIPRQQLHLHLHTLLLHPALGRRWATRLPTCCSPPWSPWPRPPSPGPQARCKRASAAVHGHGRARNCAGCRQCPPTPGQQCAPTGLVCLQTCAARPAMSWPRLLPPASTTSPTRCAPAGAPWRGAQGGEAPACLPAPALPLAARLAGLEHPLARARMLK